MPPRNDLIAFALMALAFGLMVGLAIAPGWGNADSPRQVIALPGQPQVDTGSTGDTGGTTVASLQPPAGDEATTVSDAGDTSSDTSLVSDGSSDPVDTSSDLGAPVDDPGTDPPANNYTEGPKKVPPVDNGGEDDGPAMTATVVGADDAGYAIADKSGNLLYVHYPNPVSTEPAVGKKIGLGITAVDNGTFLQEGTLESLGTAATSKLSGMVSWIDPESGVITVSSRGVSVALDAAAAMEKSISPPELGSWVTGTISFGKSRRAALVDLPAGEESDDPLAEDPAEEDPLTMPSITAKSIEAAGDPLTQIEFTGPLTWDPATRRLTIGADSFGALNREISMAVPKKLGLKNIQDALNYAVSADIDGAGNLTVAGLSANYSLEAAGDPAQAFGNHSR